jgi:hypothetical protein
MAGEATTSTSTSEELVAVTLTASQWMSILLMIDRGIEDAEYYAAEYADQDDPSGEYRASLTTSATDATAAAVALAEQLAR